MNLGLWQPGKEPEIPHPGSAPGLGPLLPSFLVLSLRRRAVGGVGHPRQAPAWHTGDGRAVGGPLSSESPSPSPKNSQALCKPYLLLPGLGRPRALDGRPRCAGQRCAGVQRQTPRVHRGPPGSFWESGACGNWQLGPGLRHCLHGGEGSGPIRCSLWAYWVLHPPGNLLACFP